MNAYEKYLDEIIKHFPLENKYSHLMHAHYFAKASLDIFTPIYSRLSSAEDVSKSMSKNMSELLGDKNAEVKIEQELDRETKKEILYMLSKLEMLIRESRDTIALL